MYREADGIAAFHERLRRALDTLKPRVAHEILYVLDPSPDGTEEALRRIAERDPCVRVLVMSRRFGHQAALLAGMENARGDAVVMLDSDGQHPPELIGEMVSAWEKGADIVQALREDGDNIGRLKRFTSRAFYRVMSAIGDVPLEAGAADFRLLSRKVLDVFSRELREHNVFLRGLVAWVGFNVAFVSFKAGDRLAGASNYKASLLFDFALRGISAFSKAPLRVALFAGLVLSSASIAAGVAQVVVYFAVGAATPGWASLMTFVSLLGGVQLLFLGLLGEYLGQVFDEVKKRPRYLVARELGAVAPDAVPEDRSND